MSSMPCWAMFFEKTGQITPEWFSCDKPRLLRRARTSVSCRSQGLSSWIAGSRRRLFVSSPSARPCSFWSWCYLNERVGLASHLWNIKNFPVINRRIVIKSIKRLATRFHVDWGLLWRSVVFLLWFANTTKLHVFVFFVIIVVFVYFVCSVGHHFPAAAMLTNNCNNWPTKFLVWPSNDGQWQQVYVEKAFIRLPKNFNLFDNTPE